MIKKTYQVDQVSCDFYRAPSGEDYESAIIGVKPTLKKVGSGLGAIVLGQDARGVTLEVSHDDACNRDPKDEAMLFVVRIALSHYDLDNTCAQLTKFEQQY